jgi:SAM-dependent methyltransferase
MPADTQQSWRFNGVWQIFVYNWHFYAATVVLDLFAAVIWIRISLPAGIRVAAFLIAGVATFWALSSLLVSHYVYDRSHLYEWNWLAEVLERRPDCWSNIHAGLDQTSDALRRLFPATRSRILDIYIPEEMTEPSIERARRRASAAARTERANPFELPLDDNECDTIFLIFAAHELRAEESRRRFFGEVCRALKPGGCVVLVEHMRDWRNFLAFGPGFLHFFSRRAWLGVGVDAGFRVAGERDITPFVRCFVFAKAGLVDDGDSSQS